MRSRSLGTPGARPSLYAPGRSRPGLSRPAHARAGVRGMALASLGLVLGGCAGASTVPSPYAGSEMREIKALDPAEVAGLLAGEGQGFALAAELNGLPGPRHVLDAAEALELSAEQRDRVQAIFDAMSAEAVRLGSALVQGERELDRVLATSTPHPDTVAARTIALGQLRGELRNVHLQAHLETSPVLSHAQRQRYWELRGYGSADHGGHHGAGGH